MTQPKVAANKRPWIGNGYFQRRPHQKSPADQNETFTTEMSTEDTRAELEKLQRVSKGKRPSPWRRDRDLHGSTWELFI
jgi:transposase